MKQSKSLELTEYCCGNCHGNTWELSIAHSDDGKTYLAISCANKKCIETKRRELGIEETDEEAWILWDQFDISGQGYDRDQCETETSVLN